MDFFFLCTIFHTTSSAAPSDSIVSGEAGIEPRTVSITALAVRRSNHSARSHLMDESKKCDTLASSVFLKITKFRIEIIRCWEDLSILAELDPELNPIQERYQDSDPEWLCRQRFFETLSFSSMNL